MNRKQISRFGIVVLLGIIIIACSFIPAGTLEKLSETENAITGEITPTPQATASQSVTSAPADFPLPPNAKITSQKNDTLTAEVSISIKDLVSFYRQKWVVEKGLKEDNQLTIINDSTFSLVFNGSSNGKSVVLQGADIGDGNIAFSIRYE
jgi:hypothetical protein